MPRFAPGDRVFIEDICKAGHIRVPWYVRYKCGEIERYCGSYANPEDLAYARRDGPSVDLYRVRLRQTDLWPDYSGPIHDTLEVEVYDHWLSLLETEE